MAQAASLLSLREQIRRIEGVGASMVGGRKGDVRVPLGLPEIDRALPWGGLPSAGVHELISGATKADLFDGAAVGFAVFLLSKFAAANRAVLWCRQKNRGFDRLYGPGLQSLGLPPNRLVVVKAADDKEALWAMEEGLRSAGVAAVLGEVGKLDLTASRRLQLASEAGDTAGLLLRPPQKTLAASSVLTRWRIEGVQAGGEIPTTAWEVELLRCRYRSAGHAQRWRVEENHETGAFFVAADLCHRPVEEGPIRATG